MDQTPMALAGLKTWEQQQAKAKFSEVVRRARSEGPQLVTTRGANAVVVLAADDYLALAKRREITFDDLLLPGAELEIERDKTPAIWTPIEL